MELPLEKFWNYLMTESGNILDEEERRLNFSD